MLSYRFRFVGLQLLLLAYTAQSFVLLTANIDDIKKLARKFVSESLADKFTDFVVQAASQVSEKMEEDDKEGVNTRDISESNEYELRNIAKHTEEREHAGSTWGHNQENKRTTRNNRPSYISNESKELSYEKEIRLKQSEKKSQKYSKETSAEQEKTTRHWRDKYEKTKESEHPKSRKPKPSDHWTIEKNEVSHNELSSQERPKNSHNSEYGDRDNKKEERFHLRDPPKFLYKESQNDFNEPKQYDKPTKLQSYVSSLKLLKPKKSDSKSREERISEIKSSQDRVPESGEKPSGSRYKKVKNSDSKMLTFDFKPQKPQSESKTQDVQDSSLEINPNTRNRNVDRVPKSRENVNEFKDPNSGEWKSRLTNFRGASTGREDGMTTKKEKTDFDQYDNRNYPKAEFIATSGKMMLPRLELKNSEKNTTSEKAWWEDELKIPNAAQLKTWLATV